MGPLAGCSGIDGEGAFSVSRSRGVRAGDAAERDVRALPRRMVNKQIERLAGVNRRAAEPIVKGWTA